MADIGLSEVRALNGFSLTEIHPATATAAPTGRKQGQREKCIDAVLSAGVTFWRDADGTAYASIPRNGTVQRHKVRSHGFNQFVRLTYGDANSVISETTGKPRVGAISDTALNEALGAFEAMTLRETPRTPELRVLAHDGGIIIDLGDENWTCAVVTASGWKIKTGLDVPLIRSGAMRALPVPKPEPDALVKLRKLINLGNDDAAGRGFKLLVGFLLAALYPFGPYPLLAIDGEQGSGKSTITRMIRRLVDPHHGETRAAPKCEDDLIIAAMNGRVLSVDNLSYIDNDTADSLCRLATGGAFGKRKLYSDGEEHLVSIARPVLLNGITSLLARADLADRAIAVTLLTITEDQRRPESAIWKEFEAAQPGILALLLDGLSTALRRLPDLNVARLPRMADFARLICAAAPAFGWTEADMIHALDQNGAAVVTTALDSDPIAAAVEAICPAIGELRLSPKGLLDRINQEVPVEAQKDRTWPKDACRLSMRLRRLAPALRKSGVDVVLPSNGGRKGREITIRPALAVAEVTI